MRCQHFFSSGRPKDGLLGSFLHVHWALLILTKVCSAESNALTLPPASPPRLLLSWVGMAVVQWICLLRGWEAHKDYGNSTRQAGNSGYPRPWRGPSKICLSSKSARCRVAFSYGFHGSAPAKPAAKQKFSAQVQYVTPYSRALVSLHGARWGNCLELSISAL